MKKSLKFTAIITAGLLLVSVPFLILHPFNLSSYYTTSSEVQLKFGQPVELQTVIDKLNDGMQFERIEKVSDAQYKVEYLELDSNREEEIKNLAGEIEGFTSMDVLKKSPVNQRFNRQTLFVYICMSIAIIYAFSYLLIDAREKSRDKAGVAFANTMTIILLALGIMLITNLVSINQVVNPQIMSFTIVLIVLSVVLNMIMVLRVNFYLKNNTENKVSQAIINFAEKYDESFVIFNLIILLILLPIVVVSRDRAVLFVMSLGTILVNIFAQTYSFVHFFLLWGKALRTLPVIKNLKWVRK